MRKRTDEHSVANRWSPRIAERGFTPVSQLFLAKYSSLQPQITSVQAMLLVHLLSYKWDAQHPFPSIPTIARRMGCSERYVRRQCESLEAGGYLERLGLLGRSNRFDVTGLIRKLEALLDDEQAPQVVPLQLAGGGR